jgi:plasmid stabilization system protein ParE
MKRYDVVFEESAQTDVRGSYDWGCRVWGKKEAQRWVRELRTAVSRQLSLMPRGFPLAPENDDFSEEIRQMIVGQGGHQVPSAIVRRRFDSGLRNFQDVYRQLVDEWWWYDNSDSTPRLISTGVKR